MTEPKRDEDIIILGGGTAGWIAAHMMAQAAEADASISVIESSNIGTIGVGEGSTPQLKSFFDYIAVAEKDWMARCSATFKNGIRFDGWSSRPGFDSYFHPFPSALDAQTRPAFFRNIANFSGDSAAGHQEAPCLPDHFFLTAALARQNLAPHAQTTDAAATSYGYHFDAGKLGTFLKELAIERGVQHIDAEIEDVKIGADGKVESLHAKDGTVFKAGFYIDCTGFRSAILQQALNEPFKSFSDNLFNDRAIAVQVPREGGALPSQTTSSAMENGWMWSIPLTARTGHGYVYSSKYCDDDQAETELRTRLDILESPLQTRRLKMRVGRTERSWVKNCLAVGLSQGFVEPLEATALHVVITTMDWFLKARAMKSPAAQDLFNEQINKAIDSIRDYIVLHYHLNSRESGAYWLDNAANRQISSELSEILALWHAGGDFETELTKHGIGLAYPAYSWASLLTGYGVLPRSAGKRPAPAPAKHRGVSEQLQEYASNFMPHEACLRQLGAQDGT